MAGLLYMEAVQDKAHSIPFLFLSLLSAGYQLFSSSSLAFVESLLPSSRFDRNDAWLWVLFVYVEQLCYCHNLHLLPSSVVIRFNEERRLAMDFLHR
ncbi:unnamed protein product [Lactuca virosa]|uniref:Uncharacterized protein n=1 Tax=Lactuca virosa TaxID=75947 RepID=A0AAU9NUV2_9ASTR|nr:unnamed protein product [Lactuca virosa]